jgi:hypothetical protein
MNLFEYLKAETYEIINPLEAKTFQGLLESLTGAIREIAIVIAGVMYVWAGVQLLTSQGKPEKVTSAKKLLWYTTIGLVIILIGSGFIDLIKSILEAGV